MRISIVLAVLAASALIPAIALAQEAGFGVTAESEHSSEAREARRAARAEARSEHRAEHSAGMTGPSHADVTPPSAPPPLAAGILHRHDRIVAGEPTTRRESRDQWREGHHRSTDRQHHDMRRGDTLDHARAHRTGRNWYDNSQFGHHDATRETWNRDWRRDRRYDWNGYRGYNRTAFNLPRYHAPRGWAYGYRRFGLGISLNSSLFARSYWIEDPEYYRLPPAYGPYRWVRYYNDALLVDVRSGHVVDTIYDIFW